jgi:protein arginine kinase activator
MLCDICQKRPATLHFTEIINDQINEIHLCEECAKEKGVDEIPIKPSFSLADLFAGLLETEKPFALDKEVVLKCKNCGLTYGDFKERGKLGCSQCYETFKENLLPLLRRIHGSTQHTGKSPLEVGGKLKYLNQIKELRRELNKAVLREEFERAAEMRDKIKELEKKRK